MMSGVEHHSDACLVGIEVGGPGSIGIEEIPDTRLSRHADAAFGGNLSGRQSHGGLSCSDCCHESGSVHGCYRFIGRRPFGGGRVEVCILGIVSERKLRGPAHEKAQGSLVENEGFQRSALHGNRADIVERIHMHGDFSSTCGHCGDHPVLVDSSHGLVAALPVYALPGSVLRGYGK